LQPINKDLKLDNTSLLQRTNSVPINRINANNTFTANQNLVLKDTVVMSFLKYKISHSADSSIFNVLKIINYKKETFDGLIETKLPEGWHGIGLPMGKVSIEPGDSFFIPFRLIEPNKVYGGQAYVITSFLKSNKEKYFGTFFIDVPVKSDWFMKVNSNTIYFNELYDLKDFKILLSNKGNVSELIKLTFEAGKLLNLIGFNELNNFVYISLPAGSDTILNYNVSYKKELNNNESYLDNIERETTLRVIASNGKTKRETIQFRKVRSYFVLQKNQSQSPLNFNLQVGNLLSATQPFIFGNVYGSILFTKKRELSYLFGLQNQVFNTPNINTGTLIQSLPLRINYKEPKYNISVGNLALNNSFGGIIGTGVVAELNSIKNNIFIIGAVKNLSPNSNAGLLIDHQISILNKIKLNTNILYINNLFLNNKNNTFMGNIGSGYSFYKHHSLNGVIGISRVKYFEAIAQGLNSNDTTIIGINYRLSYSGSWDKLKITALTSKNINGIFSKTIYYEANGVYELSKLSKIRLILNRNIINSSSSFQTYLLNNNKAQIDFVRLSYSSIFRSIFYETGLMYNGNEQNNYNAFNNFNNIYSNRLKACFLNVKHKISSQKSISANISIGYRNNYNISFTNSNYPVIKREVFNSIISANYLNKFFTINFGTSYEPFYFNSGNGIYTKIETQSIFIRPKYERYYLDRTVLLSIYGNYYLQLPSNSENISINPRIDWLFKNGLTANARININQNSTRNSETGVKSVFRNINLILGITKSFDLDQPRSKYYNLKVICYHDINGNKIREENEPFIPNILVGIKNKLNNNSPTEEEESNFSEIELMTNINGEINYINMPFGNYMLNFLPVVNLKDLICANGAEQDLYMNSNYNLYVPYSQSYRVKGYVKLNRDTLSSLGKISLKGVRITAKGNKGEEFAALTDENGFYAIDIKNAGQYLVKVNNVFGNKFLINYDEQMVDFNGLKLFELDFVFNETKRKVNFSNSEGYKFKFGENNTDNNAEDNTDNNTENNTNNNSNNNNKLLQRLKSKRNESDISKKRNDSINNVIATNDRKIKLTKLDSITNILNSNISDNNRNDLETQKLKLLAQEIRNQLGINFRVAIETIPINISPNSLLRQMIRLNVIDSTLNNDGSKTFFTGSFKTVIEAEQEALNYRKKGLKNAKISIDKTK
jgi:hypothetical protein